MNTQANRWTHSDDPRVAFEQGVFRGACKMALWCLAVMLLLVLAVLSMGAGQ
jgi:hypothetical protein